MTAECGSAVIRKTQNAKPAGVGCTGAGQKRAGQRWWGGDGESGLWKSNSGSVIGRRVIF